MKNNINYKADFEKACELYLNGMGIHDACAEVDLAYLRFKSMINDKDYADLQARRAMLKEQARDVKTEILVNNIYTHVASGMRLTQAVELEGAYMHELYNRITPDQKRKLAHAKYKGELERIKKEEETHYNKKNVKNT